MCLLGTTAGVIRVNPTMYYICVYRVYSKFINRTMYIVCVYRLYSKFTNPTMYVFYMCIKGILSIG